MASALELGVQLYMHKMAEAGTKPILVNADVSREQKVAAMFAQAIDRYGRIDYQRLRVRGGFPT